MVVLAAGRVIRTTTDRGVLYLIDDRRGTADVSLSAFAARVPELNVKGVARVEIPGEPPRSRYRLFALAVAPGEPKTLARGG